MMCRETRKIITELETQASKYGMSTLVVPSHAYIADQLVLKYFAAPIINSIRSNLKNMRTRSSKHFTIDYWVPVLDKMFSMSGSARREMSVVQVVDMSSNESFAILTSRYLITDYSLGDAEMIYNIVHKYTPKMVGDAVHIARQNNVYNIQYVNAVLEKSQAMSQIEKQKIERLASKADSSTSILDRQKVQHTPIDMAIAQYNWQKLQEDAELERKFNEILKN